MKPRLLDLFCGAGGAAMGYHRVGFEVVGVDINPQPHYPFEFHQADALTFPLEGFDAYHASPPCQFITPAGKQWRKQGREYPDLLEPTRRLLKATGRPYVIENVPGAPIRIDLMLCGTMFGLTFPRHRIFESNVAMPLLTLACNHENVYDPYHGGQEARGEKEKLCGAMGITWFMTRPEVREAIPPAYTELIGTQLIQELRAIRA